MAKKKSPAKRSHQSGDEKPVPKDGKLHTMTICLPCEPDCPLPEAPDAVKPVVVPVPTEPVAPLPAPVSTHCILTLNNAWWSGEEYVVIVAAPGHKLPDGLRTGQQVDVQFSPAPAPPCDSGNSN